jgi:hypothetical protein
MKNAPDIHVHADTHPADFEREDWHDAGSDRPWSLRTVATFAAATVAATGLLVAMVAGALAMPWRVIFSAF